MVPTAIAIRQKIAMASALLSASLNSGAEELFSVSVMIGIVLNGKSQLS